VANTKIEKLKEQKARIEARIRDAKNREKEAARKQDTRRKVILGGVILKRLKQGLLNEEEVNRWIKEDVTRKADLALFGIEEKAESESENRQLNKHLIDESDL